MKNAVVSFAAISLWAAFSGDLGATFSVTGCSNCARGSAVKIHGKETEALTNVVIEVPEAQKNGGEVTGNPLTVLLESEREYRVTVAYDADVNSSDPDDLVVFFPHCTIEFAKEVVSGEADAWKAS